MKQSHVTFLLVKCDSPLATMRLFGGPVIFIRSGMKAVKQAKDARFPGPS
jgi:hypothetical protein